MEGANRIPTLDMLHRRGILINNVNCVMFNISEETINHLFSTGKERSSIWQMCDKWIGVQSIHLNKANTHFIGFDLVGLSEK